MTTKKPRTSIPFTFSLSGGDDMTILSRPEDISFSSKKRFNRYRTRGGIVEEDWGEELDQISGNGKTNGFLHPSCGYTRYQAKDTEVYQDWLKLVDFYRNNGFEWDDSGNVIEGVDKSNQPKDAVVLTYRDSKYRGYFESLTWTEDAEVPFQFSWAFTFVVVRTVYGY